MTEMENKFYVYAYLDPSKPGVFNFLEYQFKFEPFYIGKGTKKQLKRHLNEKMDTTANPIKVSIINKIKNLNKTPIIIKVADKLLEEDAFELEDKLIKLIGRITLKNGPLSNLVDGKIGGHSNPSPEIRKKLGDATRGKTYEEIYGKTKAQELKLSRIQSNSNRTISTKTRKKIANKNAIYWLITSPQNQVFKIKNLNEFCKRNNLTNTLMVHTANGVQTNHKGWKCIRL